MVKKVRGVQRRKAVPDRGEFVGRVFDPKGGEQTIRNGTTAVCYRIYNQQSGSEVTILLDGVPLSPPLKYLNSIDVAAKRFAVKSNAALAVAYEFVSSSS